MCALVAQIDVGADGLICEECLDPVNDPHPLIDGVYAVKLGLITEKFRKDSLVCHFDFCLSLAGSMKLRVVYLPLMKQKSGEGMSRMQKGRARCQQFCMHPLCNVGFHSLCHSIMHRLVSAERFGLSVAEAVLGVGVTRE